VVLVNLCTSSVFLIYDVWKKLTKLPCWWRAFPLGELLFERLLVAFWLTSWILIPPKHHLSFQLCERWIGTVYMLCSIKLLPCSIKLLPKYQVMLLSKRGGWQGSAQWAYSVLLGFLLALGLVLFWTWFVLYSFQDVYFLTSANWVLTGSRSGWNLLQLVLDLLPCC